MKKISALLLMMVLGTAAFSQDRKGQLDSLCNQLIEALQQATEKDSVNVNLISEHMGSVSRLEIKITKLRDSLLVESRSAHQFVMGDYDTDTLKFKKTTGTKYKVSTEQLIADLKEEMKSGKSRMIALPDAYTARLYADAKTQNFSLGHGSGYGFGYLFRNGMTYEQHRKSLRKGF